MALALTLSLLTGCGGSAGTASPSAAQPESAQQESAEAETEGAGTGTQGAESGDTQTAADQTGSAIDYLVLVNRLNALPDNWEDDLETVHMTNSLGDDVEVERTAYDAYLELKADLEAQGIYVDLDSARRSVADQQRIVDEFTEKYGEEYVARYVAVPGYSEHHTGLAMDLYLNIDGQDVYENEDMMEYPEIWSAIHARLADHGFILRYLKGREHITGYSYEPWHIRYVGTGPAAEIAARGLTLEGYLGAVRETEVAVDYGNSSLYTTEDMEEAMDQIKCRMAVWEGCELHSLSYAGDAACTEDNLAWMNELGEDKNYTEVIEFLSDFHSPVEAAGSWAADTEYTNWQWWLARSKGGDWEIVTFGY